MPDTPTQSSPWKWPAEWVRDQSFWRDVATRTVAGLIVVLVVWAVGVATGLFAQPAVVAAFLHVAQGVTVIALVVISVVLISTARESRAAGKAGDLTLRARGDDRSRDVSLKPTFFFSLGCAGLVIAVTVAIELVLSLVQSGA